MRERERERTDDDGTVRCQLTTTRLGGSRLSVCLSSYTHRHRRVALLLLLLATTETRTSLTHCHCPVSVRRRRRRPVGPLFLLFSLLYSPFPTVFQKCLFLSLPFPSLLPTPLSHSLHTDTHKKSKKKKRERLVLLLFVGVGVGVTTDKQAVVTTSRDPLGLVITMKTTAAAAAVQNHLVHSTVQCSTHVT